MKTPLSFLLASVQNYLSDGADRARRLKRDENMVIVPLDTKSAEDRYRLGGLDFVPADNFRRPVGDNFDRRGNNPAGPRIRCPREDVYIRNRLSLFRPH